MSQINREQILKQAKSTKMDFNDVKSLSYQAYEDRLENGRIPARSGLIYKRKMGFNTAVKLAQEISYLEDSFTFVKSAKTGKVVAVYIDGEDQL
jgi:predicted small secreted protein